MCRQKDAEASIANSNIFLHITQFDSSFDWPLQVEATTLLLAAKVMKQLQTQHVTFLSDNLTLARAAAVEQISDSQIP
jgi:hypothetical protein